MTLGRTSSGSIKIKTDSAGGGLRAVGCACCVGGGFCGCSSVPTALKAIIESATQVSVNGVSDTWNGTQSQKNLGFGQASWLITYAGGTICVFADNGDNTVKLSPEPLTADVCGFSTPFSTIGAPVIINGQAFRAVHAFPDFQIILNITFS